MLRSPVCGKQSKFHRRQFRTGNFPIHRQVTVGHMRQHAFVDDIVIQVLLAGNTGRGKRIKSKYPVPDTFYIFNRISINRLCPEAVRHGIIVLQRCKTCVPGENIHFIPAQQPWLIGRQVDKRNLLRTVRAAAEVFQPEAVVKGKQQNAARFQVSTTGFQQFTFISLTLSHLINQYNAVIQLIFRKRKNIRLQKFYPFIATVAFFTGGKA